MLFERPQHAILHDDLPLRKGGVDSFNISVLETETNQDKPRGGRKREVET